MKKHVINLTTRIAENVDLTPEEKAQLPLDKAYGDKQAAAHAQHTTRLKAHAAILDTLLYDPQFDSVPEVIHARRSLLSIKS